MPLIMNASDQSRITWTTMDDDLILWIDGKSIGGVGRRYSLGKPIGWGATFDAGRRPVMDRETYSTIEDAQDGLLAYACGWFKISFEYRQSEECPVSLTYKVD